MVVFMTIIASFAMVFPSGFHMNLKTYRHNQAIDLANAILQEMASKPMFPAPLTDHVIGNSLQWMDGWTGTCAPTDDTNNNCGTTWTPTALKNFVAANPTLAAKMFGSTDTTTQYSNALQSSTATCPPPYQSMTCPGLQAAWLWGGVPNVPWDNQLVQISVNLTWNEPDSGPQVMTLMTYVTGDK